MAKLTAWLVLILGILLVLMAVGTVSLSDLWLQWALAVIVLVIGIGKVVRNYSSRKR